MVVSDVFNSFVILIFHSLCLAALNSTFWKVMLYHRSFSANKVKVSLIVADVIISEYRGAVGTDTQIRNLVYG